MLTKKYNPRISYISRLLALPLFALIVLAFTFKTKAKNTTPLEKEITVVIDAGHGSGNGAIAEGYTEDELVLQLAKTIKANNRNDKLKILLTRETEQIVDLKERVEFTRVNDADLFISLHMNATPITNTRRRTNGYEVGVSNKNTAYQKQSELLASALIKEISTSQKTWQALVKRQTGIWVLDQNICPSVMIDCGYITNKDDRDFIIKKENQELIAQKILKAIEVYASNNTTGKTLNGEHGNQYLPRITVVDLSNTNQNITKIVTNISDTTPPKNQSKSIIRNDPSGKVYEKVKVEAQFPGGLPAWRRFLVRNLNPQIPSTNKAPEGSYTVIAKFIVDFQGNISDVKTLTKHGYGMEEEVKRVIRRGPKWTPPIHHGQNVSAYRQQPITFVVTAETKKTPNKEN